MTDREKILKGLAACLPVNDEDAELNCGDCPYECHGGQDVQLPIEMIEDIRRVLKAQEPMVRCRDCKYYNVSGCNKGFGWCEDSMVNTGVHDNFYCADGERRDET